MVAAGLLKPLGRPAATGSKFFATVDLQALRNVTRWLGKASDAIAQYWRDKNAGRRNREQNRSRSG